MPNLMLEFHDWRAVRSDDENDLTVSLLFTLVPEEERKAGGRARPERSFWTEVLLRRDLASRGRWQSLSRADRLKAMFQFARERIAEAGGPLREIPMFWRPTSPIAEGPPWDLASIDFPAAKPYIFEAPAPAVPPVGDREAAGLA